MEQAAKTTIQQEVQQALGGLQGRIRSKVVEHFAEKQAEKDSETLIKGMNKLKDLEKELSKIRPVFYVGYDEAGKGIGEPMFSKDHSEQRKKFKELIAKFEKAFDKAEEAEDYEELFNLLK